MRWSAAWRASADAVRRASARTLAAESRRADQCQAAQEGRRIRSGEGGNALESEIARASIDEPPQRRTGQRPSTPRA
jgi:hypothetical protein